MILLLPLPQHEQVIRRLTRPEENLARPEDTPPGSRSNLTLGVERNAGKQPRHRVTSLCRPVMNHRPPLALGQKRARPAPYEPRI